jgi:glutaredoxin
MKTLVAFILLLITSLSFATTELHLYWVSTCPHCHEQIKDVNRLQALYPELKVSTFQLDDNKKNLEQLLNLSKVYQFQFGPVPVSIVGTQAWVGFDQLTSLEVENKLNDCLSKDLDCQIKTGTQVLKKDFKIQIPLLGEYDLDKNSLIISTILIGLIDGFNPCSLWVMSLLMTMIVLGKNESNGR